MTTPFELVQYNHMNQLVDNYDAAVAHFSNVLEAQFLWETPLNPFTHACLVNFGGAIIELVEKRRPMAQKPPHITPAADDPGSFWYCVGTTGFIMDWDRLGPHFAGCEFMVTDLPAAIDSARQQGLRVFDQSEYDFFMTQAEQCQGIAFELTTWDWYADPTLPFYVEDLKRADYWANVHPLGITGYRFSVALNDNSSCAEAMERMCRGKHVYREVRSSISATAVGVQIGDIVVDFLAPSGGGPIRGFIDRYGERTRAMIFKVKDMDAVRNFFAAKNVPLIGGDRPNTVAIVPDQNLGVLYQFEQEEHR